MNLLPFLSLIGVAMVLGQDPPRRVRSHPPMPDPPSFAPSWDVHITRTRADGPTNSIVQAEHYWAVYGFGVKQIVSLVWRMRGNRVLLDQTDDLYDVAVVPPHELSQEEIFKLVREALQRQLGLRMVTEKRSMEVTVLSAPKGKGPALHELPEPKVPEGMGAISGGGMGGSNRELSGDNVIIDDFCELLERWEQAVVVDETNLKGHYSFHVKGDGDLHKMLKEQCGLVISREKREIEVLRVESAH